MPPRATTLPLPHVTLNDAFWSPYQQRVREVILPYQWEALNDRVPDAEPSHAVKNFRIAAGLEQGEFYGYVFQDSDIAKWLETIGYALSVSPDPELERIADEMIDLIAKAQQPDGYINTHYTVKAPEQRWKNLREGHELYVAGHFIEAAVAYYQATGKRKILDVFCRFVDHIEATFGREPGKLRGYPGHQEIELALVKLYDVTGEERYLKLSKYFLDERGSEPYYFDVEAEKRGHTEIFEGFKKLPRSYSQSHLPVRQQISAEGHAVRATYMYSAMADVAGETGDREMFDACKRLWQDIVSRRMYITGGIGSTSVGEAFTFDYDLPNDTVYAETCASIGLILFAHRMLKLEEDRQYADVLERALYNTVLSSISLDGTRYFYVNPLEVLPEASAKSPIKQHVKLVRQKWYACACCPPNAARLLMSLGQYIYTLRERTIFTHLYIGGKAALNIGNDAVTIIQETAYPYAGDVALSLQLTQDAQFTLALRIPGWCRAAALKINGETVPLEAANMRNGYAMLDRLWRDGDRVTLEFDMPVEIMQAHPEVRANAGKAAIMRGPLVYCLEETDNGANLSAIALPSNAQMTASFKPDLLGGTVVVTGEAFREDSGGWGCELYRPAMQRFSRIPITAIPYSLWGNRTPGEMQVWSRMV